MYMFLLKIIDCATLDRRVEMQEKPASEIEGRPRPDNSMGLI